VALTGQCLCGQVTFTIDVEPVRAVICWCRDCQYIACGSASVNLLFPDGAAHYEGEVATIERTADSGNTVERGFCARCGSQLYSRTIAPPVIPMRIRAGTLDNCHEIVPDAAIWTSSAPGWATFGPDMQIFPRGPSRAYIEGRE
jgi:hypothetical protein